MRKAIASIFVALVFGTSCAHANDYVCQLSLQPAVVAPTMGASGYVDFYTSTAPKCAGALTQRFLCSKGATNKLCGVNAQYSEPGLLSVYETMRSSQAMQHPIVAYWNACINAGGSCVGGVFLYPDF